MWYSYEIEARRKEEISVCDFHREQKKIGGGRGRATHGRATTLEPSLESRSRHIRGGVRLRDHELVHRISSGELLSPVESSGGDVD